MNKLYLLKLNYPLNHFQKTYSVANLEAIWKPGCSKDNAALVVNVLSVYSVVIDFYTGTYNLL